MDGDVRVMDLLRRIVSQALDQDTGLLLGVDAHGFRQEMPGVQLELAELQGLQPCMQITYTTLLRQPAPLV